VRQPRWVALTLVVSLLFALLPSTVAAQKAGAALGGGAQFLPSSTALYLALDSDPTSSQMQYVNRLVTYYTRGMSIDDLREQALQAIPDPTQRQLVGDLNTWVGNDLFVGIPDASGFQSLWSTPGGLTPGLGGPMGPRGGRPGAAMMPMMLDVGVLAGIQIRDLAAFGRFITRLHTHLDAEHVPTMADRYGNTDILVVSGHDHSAYFAMSRGYVLFSNQRDTLTSAIDQSFAGSLAASASFQNAGNSFFGSPLAFWYANDPYHSFGLADSDLYAGYNFPPIRWTAGIVQLDAGSIRIESTAEYDPAGLTPAMAAMLRQRPNPLRSTNVAPASSVFFLGLDNLKQVWDQLNEMPGEFRDELQSFRFQFRAATGLDLDEDIFGWMTGEMGIFVGPTAEDDGIFRNVGIGLVIEGQDPAALTQRLDRIVNAVQRLAGPDGSLEAVDLGGSTFQHVTIYDEMGIYSGVAGNWAVVTTSPSMAAEVVANSRGQAGLSADPEFARVRTSLPSQVQGIEYVNTTALVSLILDLARPSARERAEVEYYTAPIRGIGISSSLVGNRVNSMVYVRIALP
jgi:hypothetical protein